jgi:glycosyltransferase involved in cell wall biosynthesis
VARTDVAAVPASRVDVGVPTLGRPDQLAVALAGVRAQTHASWRVTVSDNASGDSTPDVVAATGDPRIRVHSLPVRVPRVDNYANALRTGDAPYVTVLADDDAWHPEFLARAVAVLDAHPTVVVVHTGYETFGADGRTVTVVANPLPGPAVVPGAAYVERLISGRHQIQFAASVLRRSALPPQGFTASDGVADDLGLLLRTGSRGRVAVVAEPLVRVRVHDDSESGSASQGITDGHYVFSGDWRRQFRDTKLGFVAECVPAPREARRLRRMTRQSFRRQLLVPAAQGLRRRDPRAAVRALRHGIREDPWVAVDPQAWKWAAAALVRG